MILAGQRNKYARETEKRTRWWPLFCPYSLLLLALFSNRFWILASAHTKSSRMCRGILGDSFFAIPPVTIWLKNHGDHLWSRHTNWLYFTFNFNIALSSLKLWVFLHSLLESSFPLWSMTAIKICHFFPDSYLISLSFPSVNAIKNIRRFFLTPFSYFNP